MSMVCVDWPERNLPTPTLISGESIQAYHNYLLLNHPSIFTSPWQKIVESARDLADSHSEFSTRIESDVITPLRQFDSQNHEMRQMANIQGNLSSLAKEYDQALRKAGKLKTQGGKASAGKVAGASDQIETASQQWESQAPYVFEQLQAVDESRLNHLRDVLTQLETHEVDQVEKAKIHAEKCLNSLLNINVPEEIQSWSSQRQSGSQRAPSRAEAQRTPSRDERPPMPPPSTSRSERRMSRNVSSHNNLAPPAAFTSNGDDTQREPSMNEEKKRPRGLKRLGTVFSRRKSMMPSLGRSKARLGSSTNLAEEEVPSLPTPQPPMKDRNDQLSPVPTTAFTEPESDRDRLQPGFQEDRPASHGGVTNGVPRLQEPLMPAPASATPQSQIQETSPTTNDNFTTPPQSAADPITAAQREAAESSAGYGELSDQGQNAFNLSIRNAPIAEESSAANAAMADVASTLRASAPKRQGTLRGRRDVRNTVFIPSDQAPVFESTPQQHTLAPSPALTQQSTGSTPHQPPRPFFTAEDRTSSDTQSIRSGRSLASTAASAVVRHPELHVPGLSSSIIETVNATFESGKVTKGSVTGEVALAYTPNPARASQPARETIRLDNFPILEKVAPNPAFVQDLSHKDGLDKKGEYSVELQPLSARPNVAFKYQLHTDSTNQGAIVGTHAPVIVTPSWKLEDKQTSVIVSYALNPGFRSSGELTLNNVVFALYLEGAKTTQCQSKPAGTFSKDKAMIYWRFDELKVNSAPQKALARFATDSKAKPGRVEAKWEISEALQEGKLGVSRFEGVQGSDPFADETGAASEGRWVVVGGARKVVSGQYVGT